MNTKTGYKVVCTRDKKLQSFSSVFDPRFSVEYKLNEWVERPNGLTEDGRAMYGPFAVFNNVGNAFNFTRFEMEYNVAMYECEYAPSYDNCLWCPTGMVRMDTLPPGTRFADRVKLTRRIHQ